MEILGVKARPATTQNKKTKSCQKDTNITCRSHKTQLCYFPCSCFIYEEIRMMILLDGREKGFCIASNIFTTTIHVYVSACLAEQEYLHGMANPECLAWLKVFAAVGFCTFLGLRRDRVSIYQICSFTVGWMEYLARLYFLSVSVSLWNLPSLFSTSVSLCSSLKAQQLRCGSQSRSILLLCWPGWERVCVASYHLSARHYSVI